MTDFKYRGAGALVELHEHHLGRFLVTWRAAREEDIELPDVDDPDYASLEALLAHVCRGARTYLLWICEQLDLPDPEIDPVPNTDVIEAEAMSYIDDLLAAWRNPLREVEEGRFFRPEYVSPWGVRYCVDAMMEHAVMHSIRHRYQLEGLMGESRQD
jgi:uncharacterized damage-inducible protein DinB